MLPRSLPMMPPVEEAPLARPSPSPVVPQAVVSTYAGAEIGHRDGPRQDARFAFPAGLAFDSRGNLYLGAEHGDHSIRVISPEGDVRTLAGDLDGFADGPARDARFRSPRGLAVDPQGNVFVADSGNHRIRKISPNGDVTTLAGGWSGFKDGPAAEAQFLNPSDVALDSTGNLYVADSGNHRIRLLAADGTVSTLAGGAAGNLDGQASQARFSGPAALARDGQGALFIVDSGNGAIRKLTSGGTVSTVAKVGGSVSIVGGPDGGGLRGWTSTGPRDVAVAADGTLYVAVSWHIVKIEPSRQDPVSVAGFAWDTAPSHEAVNGLADGPGSQARFNGAASLAFGPDFALYVADLANHRIRRIVLPK